MRTREQSYVVDTANHIRVVQVQEAKPPPRSCKCVWKVGTGCVAARLCTNSRVLYAAHTPFPVSATKMEGLTDRISTTLSLRRMKGILNALAASESNVLASACENGDKVSRQHAQRDMARRAPRPPARRAANASCMFDSHHIPGGRSPGTYWDHKRGGPELPWLCQFVVPSGD